MCYPVPFQLAPIVCNLFTHGALTCDHTLLPCKKKPDRRLTEHQRVHKKVVSEMPKHSMFELEFGDVKVRPFRENRGTRRKTSRSRVENQQQTQPTYDAGSGNRTRDTVVGVERSHHCVIPVLSLLPMKKTISLLADVVVKS